MYTIQYSAGMFQQYNKTGEREWKWAKDDVKNSNNNNKIGLHDDNTVQYSTIPTMPERFRNHYV